jgi:hypothetical protein
MNLVLPGFTGGSGVRWWLGLKIERGAGNYWPREMPLETRQKVAGCVAGTAAFVVQF